MHTRFPTLALVLCLVGAPLMPIPATAQTSSADYTEPHQRRALEMYRDVIGMRTAEGHGMIPTMAEYLAERFREAGFPEEDIHVLPHTSESGEEIAAFVVRWRGDGSSGREPILFTAHMDVVDALPEDWERDPFTLIEEDGTFFGRGTADDKAGIIHLTSTFIRMKEEGFVPTRDLVIGFTGDEETGMVSTRALVDEHLPLTQAEFALNADVGGGTLDETTGEPIVFEIQTSEKTYSTFEFTAANPGGHSSRPRDDNAIYDLADALKRVQAHRFPTRINETTRAYFEGTADLVGGETGAAMRAFAANPDDAAAGETLRRDGSMIGLTRTTCVATMLRAGHAENALPQSATATVNCRVFPGDEVSDVHDTLRELAGSDIEVRLLGDPTVSPVSDLRDDVVSAIRAGVETLHPGTMILPSQSSGGTDGMHFRAAGIPTYGVEGIFMKSSDVYAHGLNERIPVRAFFEGLDFWHVVIRELAGRPSA
ncbi:MAG TPA: M20/M25/M40 family metallo-hydrolase [Longimicrobiales bacterium]|nr:M20/M25/M40 family metallo-hydrolase [Longimicrobiales bacterium]